MVKAILALPGRRAAPVSCVVHNGSAYYQRDIRLGPVAKLRRSARTSAAATGDAQAATIRESTSYRWPGCTIPYVISSKMPRRKKRHIEKAIAVLAKAGLKVVPRTSEEDYISFEYSGRSGKCDSEVGRQGGKQIVNIPNWCGKISIAHEVLHAFGMYHEQSRPDRDDYVDVQWDNITEDDKHNYDKEGVASGKYNFFSVMHYGAYSDYAKKKLRPVLKVKPKYWWAQFLLGNRSFISKGDKAAIKLMCNGG